MDFRPVSDIVNNLITKFHPYRIVRCILAINLRPLWIICFILLLIDLSKAEGKLQQLVAEMRPASAGTKEKLYDGFTKEGKGRYQYLCSRNKKGPEEKFAFPLLSSWEYGWRLGDVIKKEEIKKPPYGRTRIVADTFYTRTGIPANPSVSV